MAKLELIDLDEVGKTQQDALKKIEERRKAIKDKYADLVFASLGEVIEDIHMFNDFYIEVAKRSVEIRRNEDGTGYKPVVAELEFREPWTVKEDEPAITINHSLYLRNVDTLVDKAELLNIAVDIENKMTAKLNVLEGAYRAKDDMLKEVYHHARVVRNELNTLVNTAREENYSKIKEALKAGLDLRGILPENKVNFTFWAGKSERSEFYAVMLKANKVNKATMQLVAQSQNRSYDYEKHEYGDLELGYEKEVKVKNEYFLEDLHDILQKHGKTDNE